MNPRAYRCAIVVREGVRVKRCSGCRIEKPVEEFTKGTGPGGLHRHCRQCCKADRDRRRAASKHEVKHVRP